MKRTNSLRFAAVTFSAMTLLHSSGVAYAESGKQFKMRIFKDLSLISDRLDNGNGDEIISRSNAYVGDAATADECTSETNKPAYETGFKKGARGKHNHHKVYFLPETVSYELFGDLESKSPSDQRTIFEINAKYDPNSGSRSACRDFAKTPTENCCEKGYKKAHAEVSNFLSTTYDAKTGKAKATQKAYTKSQLKCHEDFEEGYNFAQCQCAKHFGTGQPRECVALNHRIERVACFQLGMSSGNSCKMAFQDDKQRFQQALLPEAHPLLEQRHEKGALPFNSPDKDARFPGDEGESDGVIQTAGAGAGT